MVNERAPVNVSRPKAQMQVCTSCHTWHWQWQYYCRRTCRFAVLLWFVYLQTSGLALLVWPRWELEEYLGVECA